MILWVVDRFGLPGSYYRLWVRLLGSSQLNVSHVRAFSLHTQMGKQLLTKYKNRKAPTWIPDLTQEITDTLDKAIQHFQSRVVVLAAPEALACLGLDPEFATLHNLRGSVYKRNGIPHLVTLPMSAWNTMVTQKDIGAANYGFESQEAFAAGRTGPLHSEGEGSGEGLRPDRPEGVNGFPRGGEASAIVGRNGNGGGGDRDSGRGTPLDERDGTEQVFESSVPTDRTGAGGTERSEAGGSGTHNGGSPRRLPLSLPPVGGTRKVFGLGNGGTPAVRQNMPGSNGSQPRTERDGDSAERTEADSLGLQGTAGDLSDRAGWDSGSEPAPVVYAEDPDGDDELRGDVEGSDGGGADESVAPVGDGEGEDDAPEEDGFYYEPVLSPVGRFSLTVDTAKLYRIYTFGDEANGPRHPPVLVWPRSQSK